MRLALLCSQTDPRLVTLARQGHAGAFEAIVRRYRRPLLSASLRMVPEAVAEDVVRETLGVAWSGLRQGEEVHDLRAWLCLLVRGAAAQRSGRVLLEALASEGECAVVRETVATVARLPTQQRESLLRIAGQAELGGARFQLVRTFASALLPQQLVAWLAWSGD
jgi:DNA-directed RNA polymerase specialized sigma24 family protein